MEVTKRPFDWMLFFKVDVTRYSMKNRHKIVYLYLNSAIRSIPQPKSLPSRFPPDDDIEVSDDDPDCPNSAAEENYVPDDHDFEPHTFSQVELNDLVRDLPFKL